MHDWELLMRDTPGLAVRHPVTPRLFCLFDLATDVHRLILHNLVPWRGLISLAVSECFQAGFDRLHLLYTHNVQHSVLYLVLQHSGAATSRSFRCRHAFITSLYKS